MREHCLGEALERNTAYPTNIRVCYGLCWGRAAVFFVTIWCSKLARLQTSKPGCRGACSTLYAPIGKEIGGPGWISLETNLSYVSELTTKLWCEDVFSPLFKWLSQKHVFLPNEKQMPRVHPQRVMGFFLGQGSDVLHYPHWSPSNLQGNPVESCKHL